MAIESSSTMRADVVTEMRGLNNLRANARAGDPEAIRAAAKQFEAVMVSMLMKSMREASGEDPLFGSEQGRMYGSMLDSQMAQVIAGRGIGVADMLVRQIAGSQGGAQPTSPPHPSLAVPSQEWAVRADQMPAATAGSAALKAAQYGEQGGVAAFRSRFETYAELASGATGLPSSFILGQVAVETGYGRREIRFPDGSPSHNVFSIKAGKTWTGKTVDVLTTEYVDGQPQKVVQRFRAYDSYAEAFADYANLLNRSPRYREVLAQTTSSHGFGQALQKAGYATDPAYAAKVARAIDRAAPNGV